MSYSIILYIRIKYVIQSNLYDQNASYPLQLFILTGIKVKLGGSPNTKY
jgi:hypothetical protein